MEPNNEVHEYEVYERKKLFLDNKSKNGNDLAWVMDENSVCISEDGDGGPIAISQIKLPNNATVGDVYEKVAGYYMYNETLTYELRNVR